MYGDEGLCCMSCDARMHAVANGTIESVVMRMGEELGCLTVFCHCFAGNACPSTVMVPHDIQTIKIGAIVYTDVLYKVRTILAALFTRSSSLACYYD